MTARFTNDLFVLHSDVHLCMSGRRVANLSTETLHRAIQLPASELFPFNAILRLEPYSGTKLCGI